VENDDEKWKSLRKLTSGYRGRYFGPLKAICVNLKSIQR